MIITTLTKRFEVATADSQASYASSEVFKTSNMVEIMKTQWRSIHDIWPYDFRAGLISYWLPLVC